MTKDYTPMTHEVRDTYIRATNRNAWAEFDRWLEKVRKDEHLTYRRVWYDAIVAETREEVLREFGLSDD